MTWQPIETAPKDGRNIVAMRNEPGRSLPSIIFWDYKDGWSGITVHNEAIVVKHPPTHWMPLPPPPTDGE